MLVGGFGQTAFLADFLKPHLPDWIAVTALIFPVCAIVLLQPGELPDDIVRGVHFFGAAWFVTLAIVIEAISFSGNSPKDGWFFRILVHIGWLYFWPLLIRRNHS
ncbi:MAG: hypothetical protein JNL96_05945 [Planctomycetaceae bacterium]|nr:hypothetical protein [Planctomycetaceae bacterium]